MAEGSAFRFHVRDLDSRRPHGRLRSGPLLEGLAASGCRLGRLTGHRHGSLACRRSTFHCPLCRAVPLSDGEAVRAMAANETLPGQPLCRHVNVSKISELHASPRTLEETALKTRSQLPSLLMIYIVLLMACAMASYWHLMVGFAGDGLLTQPFSGL